MCDCFFVMPSVLWRCWLAGRKGIRPVIKIKWWGVGMAIRLERGADLHMAQRMPPPLTISRFSKIQIGFTSLVLAHLGSPGKRAVKWVCVCVCDCFFVISLVLPWMCAIQIPVSAYLLTYNICEKCRCKDVCSYWRIWHRLVPTAQYYPLRFLCVRELNKLALRTSTHIPVLPFLIEVISFLYSEYSAV